MKIAVPYFDGCPSYERALQNLEEVLAEQGPMGMAPKSGFGATGRYLLSAIGTQPEVLTLLGRFM